MKNRSFLVFILFSVFLFIAFTSNAGTDFKPVQIRTKKLTMTGVRQPPPAEEPRDFQFTPVKIRTNTLTMTGMGD
jgi:hypothetical protein